jgi:GT2 family glycosyltransferase
MVDITIVYVNYSTKDDILASLKTLMDDIVRTSYTVQVVVTDNSQNIDGMKEAIAEQFPSVLYVDPKANIGFGSGNNAGFLACPARYYFAINRDTLFRTQAQTIERIVAYMDAHPKVGCIGPKLIHMDGSLQYSCFRFDMSSILIKPLKQINMDQRWHWAKQYTDRLLMKDFDHEHTRPVDWVIGGAMVVRHEVVADIGMFDPAYFMYLEDADWCMRMWEAGWPVYYVHDIMIEHRHERGSAKVPGIFSALFKNKLARIHLHSWITFLRKWRTTFQYYASK